jgi:hypothetical protein
MFKLLAAHKVRLAGIMVAVSILRVAHGQSDSTVPLPRETAERVKDTGWWPTKGTASQNDFAGAAACTVCHAGIAASQKLTPMFKAASRPNQSSILTRHKDLRFEEEGFDYSLMLAGSQATFSVQDKSGAVSVPVEWSIGNGEIGQTYVLKQNDSYFESRLSYFTSLLGLAITPGHSLSPPASLEESLGERMSPAQVTECFGCHTTASTVSGTLDLEHAIPGVMCEACHGPGAGHIKAVNDGKGVAASILNPRRLSPVDSVDFCGACHRTSVDVAVRMSTHLGLISIRFQPYRLERSLCWGQSGDSRITCIACHDPHKPLVRDTASYDTKCLQCHADSEHRVSASQAPACTVANKDCASCHMPKYEIKLAHATFTDHYIHVVRPGSQFRE